MCTFGLREINNSDVKLMKILPNQPVSELRRCSKPWKVKKVKGGREVTKGVMYVNSWARYTIYRQIKKKKKDTPKKITLRQLVSRP